MQVSLKLSKTSQAELKPFSKLMKSSIFLFLKNKYIYFKKYTIK